MTTNDPGYPRPPRPDGADALDAALAGANATTACTCGLHADPDCPRHGNPPDPVPADDVERVFRTGADEIITVRLRRILEEPMLRPPVPYVPLAAIRYAPVTDFWWMATAGTGWRWVRCTSLTAAGVESTGEGWVALSDVEPTASPEVTPWT